MTGSHLSDSLIYGHLWGTNETRDLFDDRARVEAWLDILASLAEAQADVGLIPLQAARDIRLGATIDRIDLADVAERTVRTGHSTLGLINCLREILPDSAAEWVYYGATVQDLSDTWTAMVICRVLDIAERDLTHLSATCADLAERHSASIMPGRTHGQPGLPITFGFKAAVWLSEIQRHRERIAQVRRRAGVVQLGGAVGTMEFWGDRAFPLLDAFARRTGLTAPDIAWITARDTIAEFLGLLAMLTSTLAKIGQEVYELQRPEIGELREAAAPGVVGSITMPHKRNPELSEHLVTLAKVVRADASVGVDAMINEHERDGRAWKSEWVVLPEACMLTGASLHFCRLLLDGLEVDTERMRRNIDTHAGYLMTEPVMRALAAHVGKHTAHEIVYAAAASGLEKGKSLREALLADAQVATAMSEEVIDACLRPDQALGSVSELIARVLASRVKEAPR